ncbi:hypothetical protein GGF38_000216 [Coemansia sp. RSA 25]|nr:hypothetical protein GGF38_000216 [Coemansia sp. RSA 25]
MPLAEVTWFKMDTAAQVLTHASDKLALREAIHRLARSDMPRAPFAYATTTTTITAAATTATILPDFTAVDALQEPAILADEAMGASSDAGSSAESSAGFSDAATKTGTTNEMRVVSPAAGATRNNLDLLRKTATSLSKRGGLLIRSGRSSSGNKEEDGGEARKNAVPPPTASMPLVITQPAIAAQGARPASTPQELVVRTKPHIPRVLSIFYKLVGSSSS